MAFDVGKAAAREAGRAAGREAPSIETLKSLGIRPLLDRAEERRRFYASMSIFGIKDMIGTSAPGTLIDHYQRRLSSAFGVTPQAKVFARIVGVPDSVAPFFASSAFLQASRGARSPLLPDGRISGWMGTRTSPYGVSGLYGSIFSSLDQMGFGAGGAYGDSFKDWRLKQFRAARDWRLQALLGTAGTFGPTIIRPDREAEEETHYHPDLRNWDAPETARDPEELWAEGVARGIARHHQVPVLVGRVRGGARWVIRVARRHAGASWVAIGIAGGLAVGTVTDEVTVEAIRGGVAGASGYLCYLLTRE